MTSFRISATLTLENSLALGTDLANKVMCFGEPLMRLSSSGGERLSESKKLEIHFGGSEMNVAISLAQLGLYPSFLSAVPENELSKSLLNELKKNRVDTSNVVSQPGRFGLYFLEQGAGFRGSKVIYDRSFSSFADVDFSSIDENVFDGFSWFHLSGISPAVSEKAAKMSIELVKIAKAKGLKVSLDLNYRESLWKYGKHPKEIMPEIAKNADLLLGDPKTINLMLGTSIRESDKYDTGEDLKTSYSALQDSFSNLEYIGMLLREVQSANHHLIGGVLFQDGHVTSAGNVEALPVVERIGSGDAFMAGLIYGIITEKDLQSTVDFATMACALKMTTVGDYSTFTNSEVERYLHKPNNGKINR